MYQKFILTTGKGGSRIFIGGGGGGYKREARSPFNTMARFQALGVFDDLSCYLSLSFKHSDTKWGGGGE